MYLKMQLLYKDLPVPAYQTDGASGCDLYAAHELMIAPDETVLIRTGIKVAIDKGYEGQIRPRSGLALTRSISMPNAPGTIDSDYRGEVGVILHNLGRGSFFVAVGDRIAQLVICPVVRANIHVVDELDETERGEGGFGSTGK